MIISEDQQLIPLHNSEAGDITISGRELHEFLEIKTEYRKWFLRMIEYGFTENIDYQRVTQKCPTLGGTQEMVDHEIKIDMAKEIAMIQRNEKGKQARKYFLQVEKAWNSPEMVMKRALEFANKQVENLKLENAQKTQIIGELQPKATYYDLVLQCKSLLAISVIAKDFGLSAKALNKKLHEKGVQYNQNGTWLLYSKYQDKGYTQSKTQNYNKSDGSQGCRLHTYWTQKGRLFIYDLLKQEGILPTIEKDDFLGD